MTMLRLDLTDESPTTDPAVAALREENRSLRAYLKRVLELLEVRIEETAAANAVAPDAAGAAEVLERLADLEVGLQRIEYDLETLLWHAQGGDRPAITSVD